MMMVVMAIVLISMVSGESVGFIITMSTKAINRWRTNLEENMKCLTSHVR